MKKIFLFTLLAIFLNAEDLIDLGKYGVDTIYKDKNGNERVLLIKRQISKKCNFALTPEALWSGDFTKDIPKECKKDFVITKGTIQPMSIHPEIETLGELEVLRFLELIQENPNEYLLIDSRTQNWYELQTIPSAINIPYNEFYLQEFFEDEYKRALALVGIKEKSDGTFDVSKAKTIALFCNGAWCPQSTRAIYRLLEMGYPAKKIKWYRGGMHSWNSLSLTTISDN